MEWKEEETNYEWIPIQIIHTLAPPASPTLVYPPGSDVRAAAHSATSRCGIPVLAAC